MYFPIFFDTKNVSAAHTSSTSKWLGRDLMGSNTNRHHLLCTGMCAAYEDNPLMVHIYVTSGFCYCGYQCSKYAPQS